MKSIGSKRGSFFERYLSTQDAVDCATQALEKYNIEKDIAAYIKKEFDKK